MIEQFRDKKGTSQYTGVCWNKRNKKWQAEIWIHGKAKRLGNFIEEIDAHNAYQAELLKLKEHNYEFKSKRRRFSR